VREEEGLGARAPGESGRSSRERSEIRRGASVHLHEPIHDGDARYLTGLEAARAQFTRLAQRKMDLTLILLALLGWGLGLLLVLVLMRTAGPQDRAARHEQKRPNPRADITVTRTGEPTGGPNTSDPTNRR